ncbi:tetratricopeptide repeat protein [Marinomonas posidonica]|uniref:Tetratricopeptide TPR_1 repeat-containing protein n=1 Tax=Marinomonas posidonica (strain CECT 7376 / NCIMB 14433 / IVIA-Po-181) TaxID=491952 RepID=F6CVA8_MARPP|nr:tetratricopeptide repeat protein [Marinomonas posidonica]AEF54218.1 Tetratricopeptide TPR_1 repeat-containing protein [Marinomonas posidonica IVIA-Po-181]
MRILALLSLLFAFSANAQNGTAEGVMKMMGALDQRASQAQNEGNYVRAEESRRQLISLMEKTNFQPSEIARQLSNLASVLNLIDKPEEAEIILERALGLLDSDPASDKVQLAVLNGNLGEALLKQGKHDSARARYEDELDTLRELSMESTHFSASAHIGIGTIEAELGKFDKALIHYEFAIPIFRSISDDSHPVTRRVLREYEEIQRKANGQ